MTKEFLTVREVAERTGLSRSYLYRLIEAGSLPCYMPSRRRILIRWSELELWLLKFRQKGTVNGLDGKARHPPVEVSPNRPELLPFRSEGKTQ